MRRLARSLGLWVVLGSMVVTGCSPKPVEGPRRDLRGSLPGGRAGEGPPAPPLRAAGPALGPEFPYIPMVDALDVQRVWIPARTNSHGDLVSGHWVYVKVEESRFVLERLQEEEARRLRRSVLRLPSVRPQVGPGSEAEGSP